MEKISTYKPLAAYRRPSEAELVDKARQFRRMMAKRRTIRQFAADPVPRAVIEEAILAAGTAPNGANLQPWKFVAVADPDLKARIRSRAEEEEKAFYNGRASEQWLQDLAHLETDENKPFLTEAPWLIVVFSETWRPGPEGEKLSNYYVRESTGIATGMLITALHQAGLATLTHTPSPMHFLRDVLGVEKRYVPFLVLVTGYPKEPVLVPDLTKKPLAAIATFHE